MTKKILIVEDQFIEANNVQLILEKAGYIVCGIARSVPAALELVEKEKPDLVLLDIFLKGNLTGIDLARKLREQKTGFVYLSANSNQKTLNEAKVTRPYGFLVKPFREKDILVTLDIAWYQLEQDKIARHNSEQLTGRFNDHAAIPAFEGITGNSSSLKSVLDEVLVVAPAETSVLLLGESGTGKEKIAEAIHRLSARKNKSFVKVNCAALTTTLIESELFGHERGAFTGAFEKRIGKFEQAQGGTLFLDEIGEMPMETQSKLLRVLQEKEIERVGGKECIRIDVRIIAATNRDLEKEVAEGRFRMDLYYRLHVFPITLPPLRERKEDIPALVIRFIHQFAMTNHKEVKNISVEMMDRLLHYDWPGNIRELENVMERSVLLTHGEIIHKIFIPETRNEPSVLTHTPNAIKSIVENERDLIIAALKQCNGKISGEGGAAELLQVPSSTLNSKIKKHGIKKGISID